MASHSRTVLQFYSCVNQRNQKMEVPRATASECTCDVTPNQETAQIHRPSAGTSADALPRFAISADSSFTSVPSRGGTTADFVSLNKAAITQVIPPGINRPSLSAAFAPTPMVLSAFGTAASGAVRSGSLAPGLARHHRHLRLWPPAAARPRSRKAHAMIWSNCDDHHLGHLRYVIADGYYPFLTAFAPWGFTRWVNYAVTPICAISTKDPDARDQGGPMTARLGRPVTL